MRTGPTPFDPSELRRFQELLRQKRRDVADDLDAIAGDVRREDAADPDVPIEPGERASDVEGRLLSMQRGQSLTELLYQIDRALEKIEEGVYGICEESGAPIGAERLEAKPWARFCIEVERGHEA